MNQYPEDKSLKELLVEGSFFAPEDALFIVDSVLCRIQDSCIHLISTENIYFKDNSWIYDGATNISDSDGVSPDASYTVAALIYEIIVGFPLPDTSAGAAIPIPKITFLPKKHSEINNLISELSTGHLHQNAAVLSNKINSVREEISRKKPAESISGQIRGTHEDPLLNRLVRNIQDRVREPQYSVIFFSSLFAILFVLFFFTHRSISIFEPYLIDLFFLTKPQVEKDSSRDDILLLTATDRFGLCMDHGVYELVDKAAEFGSSVIGLGYMFLCNNSNSTVCFTDSYGIDSPSSKSCPWLCDCENRCKGQAGIIPDNVMLQKSLRCNSSNVLLAATVSEFTTPELINTLNTNTESREDSNTRICAIDGVNTGALYLPASGLASYENLNIGILNLEPEKDERLRRIKAVWNLTPLSESRNKCLEGMGLDTPVPSFALGLAARHLGFEIVDISNKGILLSRNESAGQKIDQVFIPTDYKGRVLIDFKRLANPPSGENTSYGYFDEINYLKHMRQNISSEKTQPLGFKDMNDRIVLIGSGDFNILYNTKGTQSTIKIPKYQEMWNGNPGRARAIDIHAAFLEMILNEAERGDSGTFFYRYPGPAVLSAGFSAACCLIVFILLSLQYEYFGSRKYVYAFLVIVLVFIVSFILFSCSMVYFDSSPFLIIGTLITAATISLVRFFGNDSIQHKLLQTARDIDGELPSPAELISNPAEKPVPFPVSGILESLERILTSSPYDDTFETLDTANILFQDFCKKLTRYMVCCLFAYDKRLFSQRSIIEEFKHDEAKLLTELVDKASCKGPLKDLFIDIKKLTGTGVGVSETMKIMSDAMRLPCKIEQGTLQDNKFQKLTLEEISINKEKLLGSMEFIHKYQCIHKSEPESVGNGRYVIIFSAKTSLEEIRRKELFPGLPSSKSRYFILRRDPKRDKGRAKKSLLIPLSYPWPLSIHGTVEKTGGSL